MRNHVFRVSDTNRTVQQQKMVKGFRKYRGCTFYVMKIKAPMADIRQDFEKWLSISRKGVKNEAFSI